MSIVARESDKVKPWEMTWNGRRWEDMPGSDHDLKKMNFYLFRTGHLKLEDTQYLGIDGMVHTRAVVVVPVAFGQMGMVKHLEAKAERERAQRESRRESVAEQQRWREWKRELRGRLQRLKDSEHGAIRQLAAAMGVNYDNMLKFISGAAKMGMPKLRRVDETLNAIEAGSYELPKCKRAKTPVPCPEGHVPFKLYVTRCARRDGIKPHSFYAWLQRNPSKMPPILKVHGRAWFVPTTALPEEVAA